MHLTVKEQSEGMKYLINCVSRAEIMKNGHFQKKMYVFESLEKIIFELIKLSDI